jgi:hypothetical protein
VVNVIIDGKRYGCANLMSKLRIESETFETENQNVIDAIAGVFASHGLNTEIGTNSSNSENTAGYLTYSSPLYGIKIDYPNTGEIVENPRLVVYLN